MNWPLMDNNITKEDRKKLIEFLNSDQRLTTGTQVKNFEKSWSEWLGSEYSSVMVNSGSSGNHISIGNLGLATSKDVIVVSPLGWVSDIISILSWGYEPIFVDIDPDTLSLDVEKTIETIHNLTKKGYNVKAIVLTHILGLVGINKKLLDFLKINKNITLIEDCCESYGATFQNKKIGTFGDLSVFSFYFGHHLSTIEGGMVCSNSKNVDTLKALRNHGMIRDCSTNFKNKIIDENPDLSSDFIFTHRGMNLRPTELHGVLGQSQLTNLDTNNNIRVANFKIWLSNLNSNVYKTDYYTDGNCNYAMLLQLKTPDDILMSKVMNYLHENKIEFRRGFSGGGNQLRQPYLKNIVNFDSKDFRKVEHVHFYAMYLGNYPTLDQNKIFELTQKLNKL